MIYDIRDLYIYEYDTNKLVSISSKRSDLFFNTIVLKPGKYYVEIETFLKGYNSINSCNINYVKYYMILIYVWFYEFSELSHKEVIINEIERLK